MNLWYYLGVGPQEVMEDVQQCLHVGAIVTVLTITYVVNNHLADFFGAIFLAKKILTISNCCHLWQVFMFSNRKYLFFC